MPTNASAQLLTSIYALHVGSYFGLAGRIILTVSRCHAAVLRHRLAAVPRPSPQKAPDPQRRKGLAPPQ
jgi:uncharacterized iron-regulated membrane protein